MGHEYLGTQHLLLGLLAQEGTSAAGALEILGVRFPHVRAESERIIGPGEGRPAGPIPLTPLATRALQEALSEADGLGRKLAGGEDMLLGLAAVPDGLAARILLRLDVTSEQLRAALPGPPGPQPDPPQ